MKDLTGRVQRILEANEFTRGSDNILYLELLKDMGHMSSMSLYMMTKLVSEKAIPSIETVGRVRRKVQELHPELLPSSEIVASRAIKEELFREYARSAG